LPVKATVCGLLESGESLIVSAPVRFPVAVGEKVRDIVQLAPEFKLVGQVLEAIAKSAEFAPAIVMPLRFTATASLFVRVTGFDLLMFPTDCLPKLIELGETEIEVTAGVGVAVGLGVLVAVAVGTGVGELVATGVGVGVSVGSGVGEAVTVAVGVGTGVGEAVAVGVGVGVGEPTAGLSATCAPTLTVLVPCVAT